MPAARPLTSYSHGAGCGCKLPPALLEETLRRLPPVAHPSLLVDASTGDDAAVWRLDDHRALIATTDFFTPIVDDAHTWGRIAAVNAASDVFAMGGRPLLGLNLVAWNVAELGPDLLADVLAGGAAAAAECGFVIAGGHSIDDPEPKYGLAVIGEVDPARLLTNAGFRPGDALVLTKPLGVGIVTTALKLGTAPPAVAAAAIDTMVTTNADAAEAAIAAGATGATDVTGFGLLGHLAKAAAASGVDAMLDVEVVPVLAGVRELAAADAVPGGTRRNLAFVEPVLDRGGCVELTVTMLADAQTSGGLLFGAAPSAAAAAVRWLAARGHTAAVIGSLRAGSGRVELR